MGIDRVDDGDTPDRVQPPPVVTDATPPVERDARMAEHIRYRGLVEEIYAAARARDAWVEAQPGLRSGWGEHEDRYPERVRPPPRTQPDGSWVADGNRRLTPEQNAEAGEACLEVRQEGERDILPAVHRVERADPVRRLAGLEHMFKGEDRLKEKIADVLLVESDLTASQALAKSAGCCPIHTHV